jgi:hypothetical protein
MTDHCLNAPIFLLASERSGTNLLRAILGAHPELAAPTPPHLIRNFVPNISCYGDLNRDVNFQKLCRDICLALENQLGTWDVQPEPDELFKAVDTRSFAEIFSTVYDWETRAQDARRVFIKENKAFEYAHYLTNVFPDAQFIYLVRDARDMVVSFRNSPNHFGSIKDAAEIWSEQQKTCLSLYETPYIQDRIQAIHYEDLISAPENILRDVCDFIGISFDKRMLDFHELPENREVAKRVTNWRELREPIKSDNAGKYLEDLSYRNVKAVESISYRELYLSGYSLEGSVDEYARKGSLWNVAQKGLSFVRKVLQRGKLMDLDELQMRRHRVQVFDRMRRELETEHMTPLLSLRTERGSAR